MKEYKISHLIKSEDLNHHGTLFAGRTAEWLVEAAFIAAAATHGRPQDILCVNVHGFTFKKPVQKGEILTIHSRIVKAGNTSMMVHVKALCEIETGQNVEGFVTFVCVEPDTKKTRQHGIVLDEPENQEEAELRERAMSIQ
ncbi:MAG: acyl-CoA thioesterase [Firmicutes bacterium]|jgi:acyl-CoA hydrolase|nr:acyl-CoA thioesterase [Bacillota bacterium]NBI61491.1 acyl-CoA thioesterase [Clostridiales bacterium]